MAQFYNDEGELGPMTCDGCGEEVDEANVFAMPDASDRCYDCAYEVFAEARARIAMGGVTPEEYLEAAINVLFWAENLLPVEEVV